MGDIPSAPVPGRFAERPVLNSWKEIAQYFDRGVRTVQRWETDLSLPVHRIGKNNRGPVFAFRAELDRWLQACGTALNRAGGFPPDSATTNSPKHPLEIWKQIRVSTESIRDRAEELQKLVEKLRTLMNYAPATQLPPTPESVQAHQDWQKLVISPHNSQPSFPVQLSFPPGRTAEDRSYNRPQSD